jgi:hypothetical protein
MLLLWEYKEVRICACLVTFINKAETMLRDNSLVVSSCYDEEAS